MHPGAILLSALAIGATAKPLVERDYAYKYVVKTQVVTVTAGGSGGYPSRPHHHHHHKPAPYSPPKPTQYHAPSYGKPKPKPKPQPHHKPQPKPVASPPAPNNYAKQVLHHHNVHRANHSAPAIKWSSSLASIAQEIGQTCVYAHNTNMGGGGYGQNIAAGIKPEDIGGCISNAFYNGEVAAYHYYGEEPDMSTFETWGHMSQVVWKDTAEVGCATVDCSGQGLANAGGDIPPFFTVCNYKGPGNFAGEYAANVLAPKGYPTVTGPSS